MNFEDWISVIGKAIDGAGVAAIVVGAVFVSIKYLVRLRAGPEAAYREFRQGLGRSILLGLELLVAADIIRTVAIQPTFTSVGVLAVIVAVRTFLSWSLEVELEHRWPWQRPSPEGSIVPPREP